MINTLSCSATSISQASYENSDSFSRFIGRSNTHRNQLSFLQKISAISLGAMHVLDYWYSGNWICRFKYLAPTIKVLRPSLRFFDDVYNLAGFVCIPYEWTHPYHVDVVDSALTLQSLKKNLNKSFQITQKNEKQSAIIEKIAAEGLRKTLRDGKHYTTVKALKKALKRHLIESSKALEDKKELDASLQKGMLKTANCKVSLKKRSSLDRLSLSLFYTVDLGYTPLYIKGWCVYLESQGVALAAFAKSTGLSRFSKYIPDFNLNYYLKAFLCLGAAAKFFDSAYKILLYKQRSKNETQRAVWDGAVSFFECGFQASSCVHAPLPVWVGLLFISKGLGALRIFCRPAIC